MNDRFSPDDPGLIQLVKDFEDKEERGELPFYEEEDWSDLITFYEEESQLERALDVAEKGLTQYPFSLDLLLRKSFLYLQLGLGEMAMTVLNEAESVSPGDLEVDLLRAETLAVLDQYEDALDLLEQLKGRTEGADLSDVYLCESLVFEQMGFYEQMFFTLQLALKFDHNNEEALKRIWLSVELSKKYSESVVLHEEIIDKNPYSYLAWYNLGHAYSYFGDYAAAADAYEYAFLINSKFDFAYRDCAEICFELKDYSRALECYRDLLEFVEPDPEILLRMGQCQQYLGNWKDARELFLQASRFDELSDEVFFHLGLCYLQEGQFSKAQRMLEKAIRLEDGREEYYAALADVFMQMGLVERARPLYGQAIEIAPEDSEYWLRYVGFLMDQCEFDQALQVLDEADNHAVGAELLYSRVGCLYLMNRRQESLLLLENALDENYDMHPSLLALVPAMGEDPEVRALISTFQPF